MTIYRIRSKTLRREGQRAMRIEGVDRPRMERRLAEIRKVDPEAKLLKVELPA